jgi:hypothetical protein
MPLMINVPSKRAILGRDLPNRYHRVVPGWTPPSPGHTRATARVAVPPSQRMAQTCRRYQGRLLDHRLAGESARSASLRDDDPGRGRRRSAVAGRRGRARATARALGNLFRHLAARRHADARCRNRVRAARRRCSLSRVATLPSAWRGAVPRVVHRADGLGGAAAG